MVRISIFLELLPLQLCGKEGHLQRLDMHRGRGNPESTMFCLLIIFGGLECNYLLDQYVILYAINEVRVNLSIIW